MRKAYTTINYPEAETREKEFRAVGSVDTGTDDEDDEEEMRVVEYFEETATDE